MEGHTEAKNAVALGIMIVILLFRPQGIFGKKERIS
jgi:branched-subunit amino acid ABC-type transport system permease component